MRGIKGLIARKRDGESLAADEWAGVVAAYTDERIPDYQMAALLMAGFLNGLEPHEFDAVTAAMVASGERLPADGHVPWVDKHSTGGVGDKTSLILTPLVTSCGVPVPMVSGRGLGHTGGTLDKLESIPGFRTKLTLDEIRGQMDRVGCVMAGATSEMAPADRRLYALRDATATVESIPFMAASIMSKKLAEGLAGLVLDVKQGIGAFLPGFEDGLELARAMLRIGEDHGCRTVALMTAMDRPLGAACGNALEVREAVAALRGEGPGDLMEVVYALGAEMLVLGGAAATVREARGPLEQAIGNGRAGQKFQQMVEAQDGDPGVLDDPGRLLVGPVEEIYHAPESGFVQRISPRIVGETIVAMGGGRSAKDDEVNFAVGFDIPINPGQAVAAGEPVATVFASDDQSADLGLAAVARAVHIGADEPQVPPLISHRVTESGLEVLA